jgi:hypothetical protein
LAVPNRIAGRFASYKTPQDLFDAAMDEINIVLSGLEKFDVNKVACLVNGEQAISDGPAEGP